MDDRSEVRVRRHLSKSPYSAKKGLRAKISAVFFTAKDELLPPEKSDENFGNTYTSS